jgi:cGMP-specific 3',5'-cyclic phosphodiesterase
LLQILLNLARSIFEEQNNLQCLVTKIMTEARDLLKCEQCAVFLLDTECCEAVSGQDNIEVDSQQVGSKALDCIHLAQDRDKWRAFVKAIMKLRVA